MEKKEFQRELFRSPDRFRAPLKRHQFILPRRVTITIRLERLIFISITALMVMLVIYALGVEKGKRLVMVNRERAEKEEAKGMRQAMPEKSQIAAGVQEKLGEETAPPKQYAVQVATFRKKTSADEEVKRLEKYGHKINVIDAGDYYQVCVGEFISEGDANKMLKILRNRYKDCYVKKIRR